MSYADMKRSTSLRWISVNVVLFLVFTYDLSCKCPGYTSALHYAELALAAGLAANALLHARRLGAWRPAARPAPRAQAGSPGGAPLAPRDDATEALWTRAWRPASAPPPSPPSPPSPPEPAERPARDEFISDRSALEAYLRSQAELQGEEPVTATPAWGSLATPPKRHSYQLASVDTAEGGAAEQSAAAGSPHVWRRLHLDPERLTQWNLNLRLWIHVTILERLVRQMEGADRALAGAGLGDVRVGQVALERLRGAAGAAPALGALLPYLEPWPDQRYAAQRVRELARGGCLSAYRWNGGGSDWDDAKPTDAELVLHLVATYLDGQLPGGGPRPFSAEHLSAAPAPPPRLAVHRLAARPPHYALALGGATLEPARGRNNLLHTLLLLLAAAARSEPPALHRLHLGPAGLNMLWIIGR